MIRGEKILSTAGLLVAAFLVLPTIWAQAGSAQDTASAHSIDVVLPPMVVVSHRSPLPLNELSPSVSYIGVEEIEMRQYNDLTEVIDTLPGTTILPTGQRGSVSSLFSRGTESNHTAILLNGRKLPAGFSGQYDLGTLSLNNIGSVEVVRGPSSSLYGADAIGGVIDLRSKLAASDTVSGHVSGEVGSFNTRQGALGILLDEGPVSVTADAGYLTTDNDRPKSDYERVSANALVEYAISQSFRLNLQTLYYETDLGVPGDSRFPIGTPFGTFPADQRNKSEAYLISPGFDLELGDEWSIRGFFSQTRNRLEATDAPFASLNQTFEEERRELELIASYDPEDLPLDLIVGYGYGGQDYAIHPEEPSIFNQAFEDTYYRNSLLGQFIWDVSGALRLIGSARYDAYTDFDNAATGNLEVAYFIEATQTKFFAKIGSGYAPPVANDLSRLGDGLAPEESRSWEIGLSQSCYRDTLRFGLVYFETDIKNLVDSTFGGPPSFSEVYAVVDTEQSGLEADVEWEVNKQLSLSAGFTYLDAKVADGLYFGGFSGSSGDRLIRRPRYKLSFKADFELSNKWSVGAGLISEVDRQDPVGVDHEDFTEIRLYTSYALTEDLSLYARIENLLDDPYSYTPGFEAPGLGAYLGAKFTF